MIITKLHWAQKYRILQPCAEAWKSVLQCNNPQFWWDSCKRGDWMIWALCQSGASSIARQGLLRSAQRIRREIVDPWNRKYNSDDNVLNMPHMRSLHAMNSLKSWCLEPTNADKQFEWHMARTHARDVLREFGNREHDKLTWDAAGDEMLERMARIIRDEVPCIPIETRQ